MKTGLFSYKFQSSSSQGLFVDIKTLYMYLFGIPCSYGIQPKVIYLVGVLAEIQKEIGFPHSAVIGVFGFRNVASLMRAPSSPLVSVISAVPEDFPGNGGRHGFFLSAWTFRSLLPFSIISDNQKARDMYIHIVLR